MRDKTVLPRKTPWVFKNFLLQLLVDWDRERLKNDIFLPRKHSIHCSWSKCIKWRIWTSVFIFQSLRNCLRSLALFKNQVVQIIQVVNETDLLPFNKTKYDYLPFSWSAFEKQLVQFPQLHRLRDLPYLAFSVLNRITFAKVWSKANYFFLVSWVFGPCLFLSALFSTSNAKLSGSWNAAPSKIHCRERNYLKLYSIGWFDLSIYFGQSDPIFIETVLVWPTMAISHLLIFSAKCQLSTTSTNSLRDLGVWRNSIASLFRSRLHGYSGTRPLIACWASKILSWWPALFYEIKVVKFVLELGVIKPKIVLFCSAGRLTPRVDPD